MRTINHKIEREQDFSELYAHFAAFVARWGKRPTESRPRCDATAKETLESLQQCWDQKPAEAKREKPDLPQEAIDIAANLLGVDPSQVQVFGYSEEGKTTFRVPQCNCPECVAKRAAKAKPEAAAETKS